MGSCATGKQENKARGSGLRWTTTNRQGRWVEILWRVFRMPVTRTGLIWRVAEKTKQQKFLQEPAHGETGSVVGN